MMQVLDGIGLLQLRIKVSDTGVVSLILER
jgi:hypothetical protein